MNANARAGEQGADLSVGDGHDVDVVVTHFEDPQRLRWVLDSLAAQDDSSLRLHIVVADDGSATPPSVPDGVTLLRQANEGFRAAAVRNLGARAGSSPFVLFLDGDTVPTPGYCAAMVDALREASREAPGAGALVVGARRHADLSAVAARGDDVVSWCAATDPEAPADGDVLAAPQWLRDGYARTNDLRDAGDGDWRLVISAVMGMTRDAFERLDGFDESLVGYGGEDWDLAYRAWNTGVALRHASAAVAWHDGPDAGERADLAQLKEGEQLALAARIPQPNVRGRHGIWRAPRVVVFWRPARTVAPSGEYAALESWLALADVGIWCGERRPDVLADDPRVCAGEPSDDVLQRAEFIVDVMQPCVLRDAEGLLAACDGAPWVGGGVTAARTRHRTNVDENRRSDRVAGPVESPAEASPIVETVPADGPLDLEAWGRRRWS